jgi:AbrB family looped-hinge helix DNA binding protein
MTVLEDRVQVGKRGTVTLPAQLRKRYGLDPGDLLTVLDLGGVFVLSPEVSVVSKIAREIEQLREEAGLSLEKLLEGLDEERQRLYQERYGSSA